MSVKRAGPEEFGTTKWDLPPLILHPFSDQSGPARLLDSSRASLMLNGLLPAEGSSEEELTRRLVEGRLCEIRMLYFVGKDLARWIEQCEEFVNSIEELRACGIRAQSFADFLVQGPPEAVRDKLRNWGVVDFRSIFSRAIALHAVFSGPPEYETVTGDFVRNYYRYADHLFAAHQQLQPFTELNLNHFHFELYASGEYSRLLEKAWESE